MIFWFGSSYLFLGEDGRIWQKAGRSSYAIYENFKENDIGGLFLGHFISDIGVKYRRQTTGLDKIQNRWYSSHLDSIWICIAFKKTRVSISTHTRQLGSTRQFEVASDNLLMGIWKWRNCDCSRALSWPALGLCLLAANQVPLRQLHLHRTWMPQITIRRVKTSDQAKPKPVTTNRMLRFMRNNCLPREKLMLIESNIQLILLVIKRRAPTAETAAATQIAKRDVRNGLLPVW